MCALFYTGNCVTSVKNKDFSTFRIYKRSYIKDIVLENFCFIGVRIKGNISFILVFIKAIGSMQAVLSISLKTST